MFVNKLTIALSVAFLVVMTSSARAQSGGSPPGTVSGTGSVRLERPPSLVRLTLELSEQGASLPEALASLKDRREAAILALESLKATNVKISDSRLAERTAQEQQIQRLLMQRLESQGRRVPKGLDVPTPVTVGATLTAEWPLEFQSGDELLLIAKELEDRLEKADLAGVNEPKALSPEQIELAEEMEAAMSNYGYDEEAEPGKPQFLYVARISEEDRAKALAEAFSKARIEALRLAQAAGLELGELSTISGSAGQGNDATDDYDIYRMMMTQQGQQAPGAEGEAVSSKAGKATFNMVVTAAFQLK